MNAEDQHGSEPRYLFAGFCLDPADRTLTLDGEAITVQAQVFDLLHYLIQRPGAVIGKDELLDQVWGNRYLGDSVIAQAVKKARAALGDDGRNQKIIRTVHGRGISFLPQVVEQGSSEPPGKSQERAKSPQSTDVERPSALKWGSTSIGLLLVTTLMAALVWMNRVGTEPTLTLQSDQLLASETLVVFPFETGAKQVEVDRHNLNHDDSDARGPDGIDGGGLDWLEIGLAQTTALLLNQSGGLDVRNPQDVLELPRGTPAEQMHLLGVARRLEARVQTTQGRYKLTWWLSEAGSTVPRQGEIISSDSSQLARRLADAVLSELAGQPDAPLPSQPVLQDSLASELYARAIQAIYSDRRAQARALLQAALTREPDSVPLRVAYAQASFDPSNVDASISNAMALLDELIEADPMAAASLIKTIGIALWSSGEIDASASLLKRGLDLLEGRDAGGLRAALLNALALSLNSQSKFEAAWDSASRAELIFRQLGDPYHLSLVLTNMAYFAEDRGRILQAGELHQQALQIRQRYQFPQLIAASQYGLARIERRGGRFDQAEAMVLQSLATVTDLQLSFDRFDNLEELAEIHMRQRQFELARSRIAEAAVIAADNDDSLGTAWAKQVEGRIALREQTISEATLEMIQAARLALRDMGEDQDYFTASLELATAHLVLGRSREEGQPSDRPSIEQSQAIVDQLSASDMLANPVLKLQYDAARAELIAHTTRIDEAMSVYRRLIRQARQIGVTDLEAEYAIRLGQLALINNDHELARSMLAIASRWSPNYYRTLALAARLSNLQG